MKRAWEAAGWATLVAALAVDIYGWLGPRNCPICHERRSLADRAHGCHVCDIDADRRYPAPQ